MNVLHLLSWFPTPTDPNSGNFCLKHIQSVSDYVNSVVLSCYLDHSLQKNRKVEVVEYPNFKYVIVHLRPSHSRYINKWKLLQGYNFGLQYVKKHYFWPDLVHQHVTLPVGKVTFLWHKRYHLPYVLTEHWTIYQPQNRTMMTKRGLKAIQRIANHAEIILPVSEDLQHNMQNYGIHAPFRVIYNVVDTQRFTPNHKNQDGKKHILHISTLRDEAKNFSGILHVIKQLTQQRQDFVLDVVHDYHRPEFEKFVSDNHLENYIHFHGSKTESEIVEYYQNADFFLLFSNFENLPCVLVESFACGLPVITTDVGGICEIVDESRGRILHARDEAALLDALHFMLDQHQNYNRADIRQYAETHFSKPVIGTQLSEVYHTVLKR